VASNPPERCRDAGDGRVSAHGPEPTASGERAGHDGADVDARAETPRRYVPAQLMSYYCGQAGGYP
jgi:hypothetical protein